MHKIPLPVRLACVAILLVAAWLQYSRSHSPAVPRAHIVEPSAPIAQGTQGNVPGNPARAMKDGVRLFGAIAAYRASHAGAMPSGGDLTGDMLQNPRRYGFRDFRAAARGFQNPDTQYSDDPTIRRDGEAIRPWLNVTRRPDGTPIGSPRAPGTRDVLATCDLYVHMNVRHIAGTDFTSTNPVGFYIVIWDDGAVEKVALKDSLRVPVPGGWTTAFRGQAGVSGDALSFADFQADPTRRNAQGPGGRPRPGTS